VNCRAHVLVVGEGLPFPVDVRIRAQVKALVAAGYRVTVAGPTGYEHEQLDERVGEVRAVRYHAPAGGRSAFGYLREYASAQIKLTRLVTRVHKEDPVDVALVCNPPDSLVATTRALARGGTKVIFDYREIAPELFEAKFGRRGPLHRLLLWSEAYALARSDVVITPSEAYAAVVQERGRVAHERIFLVGNGPDAERMYPVTPDPSLRRGFRYLVLWLGAMSSQEGLEALIEAAERLVNDLGRRDVGFAVVGPGDVHDALRTEVARRGLADVVLVAGSVGDETARRYVSTADICVNVDVRNEVNDRYAMRKVFEYMALGKPVVQFPLREMRRLCGDTAVYARDGDARDLAMKIADLLDDRERRAALGRAAQERVQNGMMWHHQVPSLLAAVTAARA
jgi:glycosyltransferase involved in cell wall biosynthesis